MIMAGVGRIGQDPVVRYTAANEAVMEISLAFDYGRKMQDGKRPTQWIKATLWGPRCEKLHPYLEKGKSIFVSLKDVHIETYEKKDKTIGSALKATIGELDFVSSDKKERFEDNEQMAHENEQQNQQSDSFENLKDDIPF